MSLESDPSGVMTNSEDSQLSRNSAISVTIDDLAEGLIVVSFTHSDNLYQGVLFQLNRERGIPSGISFAKEHVLGNEKTENDPTQITPLHQRHSYSQGSCNGASHSSISQPSLRRVIKPPARFKNARMSLRLRARPVLCAKCMSLCDEKAEGGSKEETPKDDNQSQTDKLKKDRVKVASKSESTTTPNPTPALSLNGRPKANENSVPLGPPTDPQDLCYESVGSTRVVENYWKRPLVQPLARSSEEIYARLRKHKVSTESRGENRKRAKGTSSSSYSIGNSTSCANAPIASSSSFSSSSTTVPVPGTSNQDKSCRSERLEGSPEPNHTFLTKSIVCDRNFPNTRSRKALNLKMCITKLTELRNNATKDDSDEADSKNNVCSTSEEDNPKCHVDPNSSPASHSDTSSESAEVLSSTVNKSETCPKTRASKNRKAWDNRIRTKSTVPLRFRDQSYLTKNIFNFNKRRPQVDGNDIPVLTICRSDPTANTFKVSTASCEAADATVSTSKNNYDDDDVDDDNDDNESIAVSATTAPSSSCSPREDSISNSYDVSSSPHSPTSSSNINEVTPNFSIKSNTCKLPEMTKTPTIKITFGSSGNGMVVQIPPKDTQHVECSSTTDMKAVRKAMKKAKKEAKRKRSISPDLSPSCNALSPDCAPKSERSNPSSPVTPSDHENPAEPPEAELSAEAEFNISPGFDDGESFSSRFPKKKKKQKKKRRNSKTLKENDCFTSSCSDLGYNLSSPYSNSSLNPDSANYGRCSPGSVSVKSCNLDTMSNPDTHESSQSFGKDAPPRRRSVPASTATSTSDNPQRVCINLKRIDTNAYVPLPLHSLPTQSENEEPSSENNGVEADESEPNEYPVNDSPSGNEADAVASSAESVDFYKDKETEVTYRKGDIVWGKLPACPWWPGKIIDILTATSDEARAKVSWYKSTTQSCVRFKMLAPFTEYFDTKYARSRRRGLYQVAVRDALVEAHKLKPEDLPTD